MGIDWWIGSTIRLSNLMRATPNSKIIDRVNRKMDTNNFPDFSRLKIIILIIITIVITIIITIIPSNSDKTIVFNGNGNIIIPAPINSIIDKITIIIIITDKVHIIHQDINSISNINQGISNNNMFIPRILEIVFMFVFCMTCIFFSLEASRKKHFKTANPIFVGFFRTIFYLYNYLFV